jgi:S-adenosylmethionine:tRNA ribosyltransferase-isomerase
VKNIRLVDYNYTLPADKIASYGLQQRDQSKLLIYDKGSISHHHFAQITELLPPESTLFFNNTKVIQARLNLKRNTGALIEVFLLSPANPALSIYDTMNHTNTVVYACMIGNLKKWQEGEKLSEEIKINSSIVGLEVTLINKAKKHVSFSWDSETVCFGDIIEAIGHTPLPPYIKRADEKEDKHRYQTVYSNLPGAVAAPTAGLHFTNKVLTTLKENGIKTEYLTLHVSAGTFQPIKEAVVTNHPMHSEQIIITIENLHSILKGEYTVAVGTTALRSLESTYWFGVQLLLSKKTTFHIDKLAPYSYQDRELPTLEESISKVLEHLQANNLQSIKGDTEIFIMPGYEFKICNGLITNFHQPGSTLILLVAAFVGDDWRKIYDTALNNDYRFLSYGDSTLLLK